MTLNLQISYNLEIDRQLPSYVIDIAMSQGEHSHKVDSYLRKLREQIKKNEQNILLQRTDNEFLVKFLRKSYWNPSEAYKQMCKYVEFRENHKELYKDVNPLDLMQLLEHKIINVQPYRDDVGRRLVIYKIRNWTPSICPIIDMLKSTLYLTEVVSLEPTTQVLGVNVLVDMADIQPLYSVYLTPAIMKTFMDLISFIPINLHHIHFVQQGPLFNIIWPILKRMVNEDIIEKTHIHGSDFLSLHKFIKREYLPLQYDGLAEDYCYKPWISSVAKTDKILSEIFNLGYVLRDEDIVKYRKM